ncbi:MAG: MBL fold metallo-hydrolase [Burkholderiales bacterium]|nr:MBL fold metallo-hydrolase [Burkholderiales bacterium]
MSDNSALNDPPDHSEIELSLFGPGFGESVVIHVGGGHWIIVDSCVDRVSRQPASLQYLRAIGVSPERAVKLIVASHWHDDHIRGIAATLRDCPKSEFVFSAALNSEEFSTLTDLYATAPIPFPSGVTEFAEVLKILEARKKGEDRTPIPAMADRPLHRGEYAESVTGVKHQYLLTALSPTSAAIIRGYRDIRALFTRFQKGPLTAIRPFSPNHLAVALWLSVGDFNFLLGSDLEESSSGLGWSAIVSSSTRPSGRAHVFKIPHHGSVTAHSHDVWTKMVTGSNPVAVLTPFNNILPKSSDKTRILGYSQSAFISSLGKPGRTSRRPPKVQRLIASTIKSIWKHGGPIGHVRYRLPSSGRAKESIALFSGAMRLT